MQGHSQEVPGREGAEIDEAAKMVEVAVSLRKLLHGLLPELRMERRDLNYAK